MLHACRKRPGNADDLRQAIRTASGIDVLRRQLERRFFARAKMIKAFGILSKALEPCRIADVALRNHKIRNARLLEAAQVAMRSISERESPDPGLEPVRCYLEETRSLVEDDLQKAANTLRRLGEAVVPLRDAHEDMNKDLRMLDQLDAHEDSVGREWSHNLRYVFGHGGTEIEKRIGPLLAEGGDGEKVSAVERAIGELRGKRRCCTGEVRQILEHGLARLEQVADCLEETEHK